jgi:hypothetical protein
LKLEKKMVEKIILQNMGTTCTQFHKSRTFFLLHNPRVNLAARTEETGEVNPLSGQ